MRWPLDTGSRSARATVLVAGLWLLWLLGAAIDLDCFLQSYLWAYLFWLNVALGSLGLLLLHDLTGGRWLAPIRPWLRGAAGTMPGLALLFVPLALGLSRLWPWAADHAAESHHLAAKMGYLNAPFFLLRAVAYFLTWSLLAWRVAGEPARGRSAPGMILFVLTVTFAAFDWGMSLDPLWYSTIYGVIFLTSQAVAALAMAVVAASWQARQTSADHWHDLGNLMLAFVSLWAYIAFSQWLIIWSGNIPEEISWYLPRIHGGWGGLALALIVLHFAVPFVLLLNRPIKRRCGALTLVSALLLLMQMLHTAWLIVPSLRAELDWRDALAAPALGGAWIACSLWVGRRRSERVLPVATG